MQQWKGTFINLPDSILFFSMTGWRQHSKRLVWHRKVNMYSSKYLLCMGVFPVLGKCLVICISCYNLLLIWCTYRCNTIGCCVKHDNAKCTTLNYQMDRVFCGLWPRLSWPMCLWIYLRNITIYLRFYNFSTSRCYQLKFFLMQYKNSAFHVANTMAGDVQGPILPTWFNFNLIMNK